MLSSRYTTIFNEQQTRKLQAEAQRQGKKVQDILRSLVDSLESPDCVGDELEQPKELKPGDKLDPKDTDLEEQYHHKKGFSTYAYFPKMNLVAIKRRSKNWSHTWWEVVEVLKNVDAESWEYQWFEQWERDRAYDRQAKETPVLAALKTIASYTDLKLIKKSIAGDGDRWMAWANELWTKLTGQDQYTECVGVTA